MALTPKEIRKAIKAHLLVRLPLESAVYTGVKVFAGRFGPYQEAELLPSGHVVNVFSNGGEAQGKSVHIGTFDTVDRLMVNGVCVLPDGVDYDDAAEALADLVDDLEQAIKTAVNTHRPVSGAAFGKRIAGMSTSKGIDAIAGETMQGHVEIEFRFTRPEYYAPAAEPGTPDPDFEQLDIIQRFGLDDFGALVTEAGDTLVTEEGDTLQIAGVSYTLRPIMRIRWATEDGDSLVTEDGDNLIIYSQGYDEAA